MRTFTVLAPLVSHEAGDVVTADDLAGANIDALVASGHLKEMAPETQTTQPEAVTMANEPADSSSGETEGAGE